MHLSLTITYTVEPERIGDKHIMDWLISSQQYEPKQLQILNCCRLHLHITTVSELFDTMGKISNRICSIVFDPSGSTQLNTCQYNHARATTRYEHSGNQCAIDSERKY